MLKVSLGKSDNVFFTSDTHFCHGNIIRYCNRPFESIQEMNEKLIENWNNTVPKNGIVFILGDFAFANKNRWKRLLEQLNGKKYLILGNHDQNNEIYEEGFEDICDLCMLNVQLAPQKWQSFLLSHRPILCWERSYNTIMLYGHVHSGPTRDKTCTNGDIELLKYLPKNTWDVGVDNNNFRPISVEEVLDKCK